MIAYSMLSLGCLYGETAPNVMIVQYITAVIYIC